MQWLRWLFSSTDFVTREKCGDWGATLPLVYQWANALIALAYFLIPVGLLTAWLVRREVFPRPSLLILFAVFITLCGVTHVLDLLAFHWPAYRFFTVVEFATAAASLLTAAQMPSLIRHVKALPSPKEYAEKMARLETESAAREALQKQLEARNIVLRAECDEARAEIEKLRFASGMYETYMKLREKLHEIRNA